MNKFSLTDRFGELVKSIFGYSVKTKAAKARAEQSLSAHGDTFRQAMAASFTRQIEHNARSSYRRNSRGLPMGVSRHQVDAARRLKNLLSCRPDEAGDVGETRIAQADTTLDIVRKNAEVRTQHPRPSKLARRLERRSGKTMNLKEWCRQHTAKMQENRRNQQVPYRRPVVV